LPGVGVAATLTLSSFLGQVPKAGFTTLDRKKYEKTDMATLHTTIPDDLSRQVHSMARARGIPVHLLIEEALRCMVSPEPFATDADALAEMESMESDVLKDHPWEK
jgi:predicted transcriptional regulator